MAFYSFSSVYRQRDLLWGPYTVVCKRMKSDEQYCKLAVQIQYVYYNSTFSIPPHVKVEEEPVKFISLRFISTVIPVMNVVEL